MAAYTTIDDPSAHHQTVIYTGDGNSNHAITYDGNSDLQPDFIWNKVRTLADSHALFDSTRGVNKILYSNITLGEGTDTNGNIESFDTDGITVGGNQEYANKDGAGQVSWGWKANGGSTSSNTSGDITSTVQVNSTAGFSIGTYTGDGDNTSSVGHGLGAIPALVILKSRTGSHSWIVWHQNLTATTAYALDLENTDAQANNASYFYDTAPDANTFHPGDGGASNGSGTATLFYAWKEVQGFSKFGSYTGNGNADGTFIYTGFKPAWLLVRESTSGNTNDWFIYDIKRSAVNPMDDVLLANDTDAESTGRADIDFLSNGFKCRATHADTNRDDGTFLYAAFAHQPFVTSGGVPCTAH